MYVPALLSAAVVEVLEEELIFEVMPYQNPSLCDMQCQACNVQQTLTRMYYWFSEVPITSDRCDVWYRRLNTSYLCSCHCSFHRKV